MAEQTINPLPAAGSTFIEVLRTFLGQEDADRYVLMFRSFVAGGGLHATAAGLTSPSFVTTAFPNGIYSTEAGLITYANNSTTWVIMDSDTVGDVGGYTRVAGTHYLTAVIDTALPSGRVRLMKVTTSGGAITVVVDQRQLSPLVNKTNDPYLRLIDTAGGGSDFFLRNTAGVLQLAKNTATEDQPTYSARFNFVPGSSGLALQSTSTVGRTATFPDKDGTVAMLSDIGSAAFASGTRMLFDNDSAPSGWTRDAVIDDRVPRIVTGARGPNGGSWTVSGISVASHTHTLSAHKHDAPVSGGDGVTEGYVARTASWTPGASANTYPMSRGGAISVNATVAALLTGTPDPDVTGGTSVAVSSDASWRPLYRDVILCQAN